MRISMTRVKVCQINACGRAANQNRLRETRLVLKLYYTDSTQVLIENKNGRPRALFCPVRDKKRNNCLEFEAEVSRFRLKKVNSISDKKAEFSTCWNALLEVLQYQVKNKKRSLFE